MTYAYGDTFVSCKTLSDRAGDAAGPLQTSFRRVKYLRVVDPEPGPSVLAQSSDGQVKVLAVEEEGVTQAVYTYGKTWELLGEGFTSSEAGWDVTGVSLRGASGEEFHELGMVVNGNDSVQALPSGGYSPAEGTYPDATLKVDISRDDGGTQVRESLEFPFPFKVRPDEP